MPGRGDRRPAAGEWRAYASRRGPGFATGAAAVAVEAVVGSQRKVRRAGPIPMASPSASSTTCAIACPLTKVPFLLRSSMVTRPDDTSIEA